MMAMERPGNKMWGDIVIASCWYTDDKMALLLLTPIPGQYYKYELWDMMKERLLEEKTFDNIIPAAKYYDETTGCWGEG